MSLPGGPGATQAWKSHVTAVCNAPPTQYPVPASGVPRYKSPPNQESQRHAPTRFVWSIQSPPSRCPPPSRCGLKPGIIFPVSTVGRHPAALPLHQTQGRMSQQRRFIRRRKPAGALRAASMLVQEKELVWSPVHRLIHLFVSLLLPKRHCWPLTTRAVPKLK